MIAALAFRGTEDFCKQLQCNTDTYGILLPLAAILSECKTELLYLTGKDLNNDVFRLMGLD